MTEKLTAPSETNSTNFHFHGRYVGALKIVRKKHVECVAHELTLGRKELAELADKDTLKNQHF